MELWFILLLVVSFVFLYLFFSGGREGLTLGELKNVQLLSYSLHKSKEAVPSDCNIPTPSRYIAEPLIFDLEEQKGQGWSVFLVHLPFNINGQRVVFKALLDTGSDHLVLLGKKCACSKIYRLYPSIGKTTPSSCDIKNRYGDGTEYLSGRKEGTLDFSPGLKFSFNYVKKLIKRSITGSQVYPICGLSTGQKPNFMEQMFKTLHPTLPKIFSINFPSKRFSIGESVISDVTVPIATKADYSAIGLPYLYFYMVSPKLIQYQDSEGLWEPLQIEYIIPDTGSVSFAVGPSFMKTLDIKAIKFTFEDSATGKELSLGGLVQPGQAKPLIEQDNVLLVPIGFLDEAVLSFDLENMTFGLSK